MLAFEIVQCVSSMLLGEEFCLRVVLQVCFYLEDSFIVKFASFRIVRFY